MGERKKPLGAKYWKKFLGQRKGLLVTKMLPWGFFLFLRAALQDREPGRREKGFKTITVDYDGIFLYLLRKVS